MNDYDAVFATVKFYQGAGASPCHKAVLLTTAKFDRGFPGWQIYHRLVTGDCLFDRAIEAYFVSLARTLARCRTRTGRDYIGASFRDNGWIAQAGRDAMDFVLFGRHVKQGEDEREGLHKRAAHFGVANKTYQKIREPIGVGMRLGMDTWISELHYQFSQILSHQKYPDSFLAV